MLQWKPKSIALVAVLLLVAALAGQFTWESFGFSVDQFTWY
jgi:small neutral amino acid transporter SnatA (MarC family)